MLQEWVKLHLIWEYKGEHVEYCILLFREYIGWEWRGGVITWERKPRDQKLKKLIQLVTKEEQEGDRRQG